MGRFTLRDEGKTICVGRVLKYKPYSGTVTSGSTAQASADGAKKAAGSFPVTIDNSNAKVTVFDMETGQEKEAAKELPGIAEGNEDEDD